MKAIYSSSQKYSGVWFESISNRGALAFILGFLLTLFYILIYWAPEYLGLKMDSNSMNTGFIAFFDPLSRSIKGSDATQWFVYGTLYTFFVCSFGIKFLFKHRTNHYQLKRTIVLILSQLVLAYIIPEILSSLNYNDTTLDGQYLGWYDTDIKNMWPLDYDFFQDWHLQSMTQKHYQPLGIIYLVRGIVLFLVVTPILTYFWGKRWYCSWICGCGGLAETAGDSFRQLSSKTTAAWKIERWSIHIVLVWVFVMTAVTLYGHFTGSQSFLGLDIYHYFQKPYGFLIGAFFSGVVGVGFYPLLGNRIWCRFGCPLAAYMGIFQRFKSRFQITVNGGQCISCGSCSTYCEQGIDVRWYAQRSQNITRASCVGCGICSDICPRGVLKLENITKEALFFL